MGEIIHNNNLKIYELARIDDVTKKRGQNKEKADKSN